MVACSRGWGQTHGEAEVDLELLNAGIQDTYFAPFLLSFQDLDWILILTLLLLLMMILTLTIQITSLKMTLFFRLISQQEKREWICRMCGASVEGG